MNLELLLLSGQVWNQCLIKELLWQDFRLRSLLFDKTSSIWPALKPMLPNSWPYFDWLIIQFAQDFRQLSQILGGMTLCNCQKSYMTNSQWFFKTLENTLLHKDSQISLFGKILWLSGQKNTLFKRQERWIWWFRTFSGKKMLWLDKLTYQAFISSFQN